MIWGYIYIALMLSALIVVWRLGSSESRLAITTLFSGSALTLFAVWYPGRYFESVDALLGIFDFAVLAAFFGHAMLSRRYWTLWLPALQLNVCLAHAAKYVAPEILPRAYSMGQGFWAYPMIALIVAAACWENAYQRQTAKGPKRAGAMNIARK